ncbi:brachyurin-like [Agrilus planipennis]|uniref:Brachyurin-like n=1 Tax=Agrilus planipennis TaxID=224129 RepID=A0A1W4X0Z8_AGRPL|nr:brachyurin-like [Agrilus planipennis]
MKEISLIFITFSLVTAHVTGDWFNILSSREIADEGLNRLASSEDTRIVGGYEPARNSIPYVAVYRTMFNESEWDYCEASLISTRYVLTVAHCLMDNFSWLEVVLGAHNYYNNEPTQQTIRTTTFKVHEQFSKATLENDLGVIYLPTPAKINRYVQLIALPSRADASNSFAGSKAIMCGWGDTSDNAVALNVILRCVNVTILTNDKCNEVASGFINSNICTSGSGKKGACFGDSGGPLVTSNKLIT